MKYIEPISFYNNKEPLLFYLIDCGSGLTHLIIFPDNTVMLFDCNLVEDNFTSSGMDAGQILDFFKKVIPYKTSNDGNKYQPIDIFVNSHRDTDHLKGLKEINAKFPIQSIWDSGCTGENTDNADYQYYMCLRRRVDSKNEPTPSDAPIYSFGGAKVYCLSDANDFREYCVMESFSNADKKQHTNCMVLLVTYAGRKMLLTGDSGWEAWRDKIVPKFKGKSVIYENTDILIASHHGSRSFFTSADVIDEKNNPDNTFTDHIKLIAPKITLISCGNYNYKEYHLPNTEALKLYKDNTSNEQVYTTNKMGTLCGRLDSDGSFSVTPSRFKNSIEQKIRITCKDGNNQIIKSGDTCQVGKTLYFKVLNNTENFLSNDSKLAVSWQVCNAGQGKDIDKHEIYCKDRNEPGDMFSFTRELVFVGTHLLRCTVKNSKKGVQTVVFAIHGV